MLTGSSLNFKLQNSHHFL